jgi:AraC-like DNA-binding protein
LNAALTPWDAGLRGAAAALLLWHLLYLWGSALPRPSRWALGAFVASVLAYLVCSHASYANFGLWLQLPALSLCLMSAPLLWLAVQAIFDDDFAWSLFKTCALGGTLAVGWVAYTGFGGAASTLFYKTLLIVFSVATLWMVLKHWHSDLVSPRRRLRTGVAGGLSVYVLVVVCIEIAYLGSQAPDALALLHLVGITLVAGLLAQVMARHPPEQWLRVTKPALPVVTNPLVPDLTATLTQAPQAIDRKAALRERVLQAMSEQRAYAQEGLTLAVLATQLETTPALLRESINHHLGYRNFNDFLHHYRIDEAAQRLQRQDLPILSIALDVGYGSIGPFNRAFKHILGSTPSEFRAQKSLSK